ncbi:hypothetical protein AAVH_24756 [Aphelenchoides avenae]|nr:hypothetical protein AAVH_24756 [Aphelenchus avenae]
MYVYFLLALFVRLFAAVPILTQDDSRTAEVATYRHRPEFEEAELLNLLRVLNRARRNPQETPATHYPKVCYYSPIQCLFTRPRRTTSMPLT